MRERTLRGLVALAAILGLILAVYAALEVIDSQLSAACSFNGFFSCGKVAASGKTTILGLQDYLWGIGGFVLILGLAIAAQKTPQLPSLLYALAAVTGVGVALSVYLAYVELVEINALCIVCFSSYAMGGLAFGASLGLARHARGIAARAAEDRGASAV